MRVNDFGDSPCGGSELYITHSQSSEKQKGLILSKFDPKYYTTDPETGFLTKAPNRSVGITSLQKKDFLEIFKKNANFTKACKMAGIDKHTICDHFQFDAAFYRAYRDAVDELCDEREESLFAMGKHNVTAAFGFLKAFRPHIWNERKIIEQKDPSKEKLNSLLEVLEKEKKAGKLLDVKDLNEQKP